MKLDTRAMRYLTSDDWRVLQAVEQGTHNHELVPTPLISKLSHLHSPSAVTKSISTLAKANLISRLKNASYDGYRLTYGGLDYLALHQHQKKGVIYSVGNQIGIGKESDIIVVASPPSPGNPSQQLVLKIHRLGRISFRTVKANRDYLKRNKGGSWMYMSRLAAQKEYAFMEVLHKHGFVVPRPVAQSRHTVVMQLVDAFPLRQIRDVPDPAGLYEELIEMVLRLARYGLIHGDFNEFNILIREEEEADVVTKDERKDEPTLKNVGGEKSGGDAPPNNEITQDKLGNDTLPDQTLPSPTPQQPPPRKLTPVLIDFPQTLSIDHPNAPDYFDRDINCIKTFFSRRFHFTSSVPGPFFADAKELAGSGGAKRLDVEVEATGFSRMMAKELEKYMKEVGVDGDAGGGVDHGGDEEEEEEENDEDDETVDGDESAEVEAVINASAPIASLKMSSLSIEHG